MQFEPKTHLKSAAFFLGLLGLVFPISGALIFPASVNVTCALPSSTDFVATFNIQTDSGSVNLTGLPQMNSFLRNVPLVTATPTGGTVNASINPARLMNGHNKAYIAFYISGATTYSAFVVIDVNCTIPQSTIYLTSDTLDIQVAQGSGPVSFTVPSEINGQPNLGNTSPVTFTMTTDTASSPSPWITSASVPGSSGNTGSVKTDGSTSMNLGINPAGLATQAAPYLGFVHIRDIKTGFGSADLTVSLTVGPPASGNAGVLPHFAVNGPYTTGFNVVNTGTQNANFAIAFFDDNGNPIRLPVTGMGLVNQVSATLPPNGSAYIEAGDSTQQLTGGSATINADPSIAIQSLFRLHVQDNQGSRYFEAAVPSTFGSTEFHAAFDDTIFAPTGEQIRTGIAIANVDKNNPSVVSCTARDQGGNVIPGAITVPVLPPGGHWADFDFKPLFGKRGSLDCSATTTVGAMGIHAFANGAISSLPVVAR